MNLIQSTARNAKRIARYGAGCITQWREIESLLKRRTAECGAGGLDGTVQDSEQPLLRELVEQANRYPGPIIEIGTLFGFTTNSIAIWKTPEKQLVTVDVYCWNPLDLNPDTHFQFTTRALKYLKERANVEQVRMDKNAFYDSYKGEPPAMVFLDAIHDYPETRRDILWAKKVGARIISGHDYMDEFPGVKQAVHEFGGPARLARSLWSLS